MARHVRTLGEIIRSTCERSPSAEALIVGGETYDYASLLDCSMAIARTLSSVSSAEDDAFAIYGRRSITAYSGVLGTLFAERCYVPLNPAFPPGRSARMLRLAGARCVVVDGASLDGFHAVAAESTDPLTILCPEHDDAPTWASETPQHRFLTRTDLIRHGELEARVRPSGIAYLLFTSGTTGDPKGIGIPHRAVGSYLRAISERYDIGAEDRLTQNFELTFDLSVHDMFVAWSSGACLCVPSPRAVVAPARFVRDHAVTCWFSTPSTATVMSRLRMLAPDAFPALRWSFFCGEALPQETARQWQVAAPNSTIENLYGPTEATIACTAYTVHPTAPEEADGGIVPIGRPFGTNRTAVVGDEGSEVANGEIGELVIGGAQLADGYWKDEARSAEAFVELPQLEGEGRWYRTGDLVSRRDDGQIVYRGRKDDQVKIRGHRVELLEIERAARLASDAEVAVAIAWPRTPAGADGVVLYLVGGEEEDQLVLDRMRQTLPLYMIPSEIHRIERVPLNPSGKIDRKQLVSMRAEATR